MATVAAASFVGAHIRNVDFAGADLSAVDFTDADWFNALGLIESQLRSVQQDTVAPCPPTVQDMHGYLEAHYAFPFQNYSSRVRDQIAQRTREPQLRAQVSF